MNQTRQIISIPLKIKRSPTDLLKALSQTVVIDSNVPNYSLIDDTILTPSNQIEQKRSLLSKASGIKAARFMIEKYPQAFMKDDCVPHISKFFPPKFFTEEDLKYPSEELVKELISWGKFKEAFNTYLKCKDLNINVSEECKMNLLDVLSIYNSSDYEIDSPIMEKWYTSSPNSRSKQTLDGQEIEPKKWSKNDAAELMFKELKEKSAQAYCSLIKGMAQHLDLASAKETYEEMKKNNLNPDLNTINLLISYIGLEDKIVLNTKKKELIMEKLQEIKALGLMPNLKTFNSCLKVISSMGIDQENIPFTLNILKEMEILNIKPCLATWSYVLNIFYPNREYGPKTQVFYQVIEEVEAMSKNGLEWKDLDDSKFFTVAMEKCLANSANAVFSHRIHKILIENNNIRFLNNEYFYTGYFENYISTLIRYELPEIVIKEWRAVVPFTLNRSKRLLKKMFDFANDNSCLDLAPELWSSFIEMKQRKNVKFSSEILKVLLELMVKYQEKTELAVQYGSIINMISKSFPYFAEKKENITTTIDKEGQQDFLFEFSWDSRMLENFFSIALNSDDLNIAWKEFENYKKNSSKINGELGEKCISNLFNAFLDKNDINKAINILDFASSHRMSPVLKKDLIEKLKSIKNLNDEQQSLLKNFT